MAEIGKFSMIIAHELKNPLGIIKGSVDILSKSTTDPDTKITMETYILEEVQRLNKLIDDFLAFAKPTPLMKILSDINTVVKKASEHFIVPEEYNKKIKLCTELNPLPEIEMDDNQIYHVLLNLINNAVQAIENEGTINLKTEFTDGWIKIVVSDSGPGISKQQREQIFEPFFTTKAKGTGLGLAIVKKIVVNHAGHITVSNMTGGGACFEIFLPAPTGKQTVT
jgi:signal transduction histidine kinase